MSWRTVVISRSAKLDYQMGYMVVRSSGETNQIYLRDIRMVLVESTDVSITAALVKLAHRVLNTSLFIFVNLKAFLVMTCWINYFGRYNMKK